MDHLLPVVTALLCGISAAVALRDLKEHPLRGEAPAGPPKSAMLYGAIMIVVTLGVSLLFCAVYRENGLLANAKRMALLSILWPIAYIDLKSCRIPNRFILLGLIYRGLLLILELIFARTGLVARLLSEGTAAAALLLASGLCVLCIKNAIGFGDIKLFVVMGLLLGLEGIWSAVFLALLISFALAVYVLLTKKKTRKDAIPFGPAIVIGTYLSVCLSGV